MQANSVDNSGTRAIHASEALLPEGWAQDVLLHINRAGEISRVEQAVPAPVGAICKDMIIPAPANLHSHAFQRSMAGLTERRGPETRPGQQDSFWTWRQLMFRFLDQLTPEHIEAIAAFVQMEMAEAGYGASVEFHYLHHQPGGVPYANLAELSDRIAAAAQTSQIGLTLLPVLYQVGGCDGRPLGSGQIRFGNDPEMFSRLTEAAISGLSELPKDTNLGIAPHSLRAVTPDGLKNAIGLHATLPTNAPLHMHLAEQIPEVEEVLHHWQARPVEYLLANTEVTGRWCLIHCTQMLPHETEALAKTGAVAGLCPITESSLGDGIFDGVNYLAHGGRVGIGSDSNIRISLSEELRTLEYSQRLRDKGRAIFADETRSTARRMFDDICIGGARAAGRNSGAIAVGKWADLTAIDMGSVHMTGRAGDTALDSFVFAGDDRLVTDVWSAGRHIVVDGRHFARDEITTQYRKTLSALKDLM